MRLLDAARRKPVDRTPVWFMRQAGRYLPEYRALRERHSMLALCKTPDLAARVTLLPIERFPDLDAAILFSDLLLVLEPMGAKLAFTAGEGPVIRNPVRTAADVAALRPVEPARDLAPVLEAIRIVKRELGGRIPLLGFAGAPFTLASYFVEGGSSRDYAVTKALLREDPAAWHSLAAKLADASAALLEAQIAAGVDAVQVFDSWVGALSPAEYREFALPHSRRIFDRVRSVPTIHFGTRTDALLELMKEAGGDVIGLDPRVDLAEAWNRLGEVSVQGNLDPAALLAPRDELLRRVDAVLDDAAGRPGHIFNLGHGVLPETPPESVAAVLQHVHERTAR